MGGVDTDTDGATSLPGLFAAGEVACVSINGANRLGSNSLTELLVFGARAGRAAAIFATQNPNPDVEAVEKQGTDEQNRIARDFIRKEGGTERIATLRREMNDTMESGAGIYRSEQGLRDTCDTLMELRQRFSNLLIEDRSLTFQYRAHLRSRARLHARRGRLPSVAAPWHGPKVAARTSAPITPIVTTRTSSNIPLRSALPTGFAPTTRMSSSPSGHPRNAYTADRR